MMTNRFRVVILGAAALGFLSSSAWGINDSIPFVNGDVSRLLLGDGTGVIIGVVDSGVDDTHPALAGVDSLGNPRMVAEANFVPTEPGSTGDDVAGHGTWVTSALVSSDTVNMGMAPDARFINARVLDSTAGFNTGSWVEDGVGFAIEQGADILNLSLNFFSALSSGTNKLDQMLDWAAFDRGINIAVAAGNISQGSNTDLVRSPGSLFNGLSVGRTTSNFARVDSDGAMAPTADGRMKPDLVAPGTAITLANDDWEFASDWQSVNGTSFATPHVAGLMAQQLEYGNTNGLSTNPLVVRSTIINSTLLVRNKDMDPWEPGASSVNGGVFETDHPLDFHSGAGQIDGERLYDQYSAGEQEAGTVEVVGWDLDTIVGTTSLEYALGPALMGGTEVTVSLAWFRHIRRFDNGDNEIGAGDFFSLSTGHEGLDNLDLEILLDGAPVAASISTVDNLEFLRFSLSQTGSYSIRVSRLAVSNTENDELFGLAWHAISAGDFDQDGDVDGDDFLAWQTGFGPVSGADISDGDADFDGDVDGNDFLLWQSNSGSSSGAGALAGAVPEPTALGLLLVGTFGLIGTARRIRMPAE